MADDASQIFRTSVWPENEAARQKDLESYAILDTPPEGRYDRLTRLAAALAHAPIALLSFVDGRRQWFKSRTGLDAVETPREWSFCAHAILSDETFVIPDARRDERFVDNPLVTGAPGIRMYVGAPLRTPDGNRLGTLCVIDCVDRAPLMTSQIKLLEDLASLAMDELELRRAGRAALMLARNRHEMTQRLDTAHRSLFAAYTAKSQFLSSLSHELRTPLNSVTGFADLVARGIGDPKSHAAEIQHAGEHMLSLINDILDFSRIEADQMPLAFQRVRLAKQMDEASRLVAVFARDRGVKIGMDIACPDSEVMGDARRLKQVILNLLTNAVKFTPAGGTVTMRLGDSADGGVLLEVSDCGCGIAPEDIPKVLTPFGQVVGSGGVWPEGTGLGLPISKALVEKHQGTLGVSSTPGVGTVVSVWLPQHRTEISA